MTAAEARALVAGLHPTQIALGLDRMHAVLERLGHPERCAPSLHVAGTNGKGSVCAIAERALRAAGQRTGFYSSPHLLRFEERIRIDGEPLGDPLLVTAVEQVQRASEDLKLTYFEFGTAMAFVAFREAKVAVQVLETGLGGRLDATNTVVPVASAITTLGLDHTAILGDTLGQIAFEKAGILKPGVPCAVARPLPETEDVLVRRAREVGTRLWIEGRDFDLVPEPLPEPPPVAAGDTGDRYRYWGPTMTLSNARLGLRGAHQRQNGAVALGLLEIARNHFPISDEALKQGLSTVSWPGRLQVIPLRAGPPGVELALDGAHNPQAAKALADAVRMLWPGRPITLVFGVLDDKDLQPMLERLVPLGRRLLLTTPKSPRARNAESYLKAAATLTQAPVSPEADSTAALERAVLDAKPGELILVCGSLYLVAEALRWLEAAG